MAEVVIQDHQIATLSPSFFTSRDGSAEMDYMVREKFYRLYKPLRDGGTNPYFLSRISSALYFYRPLLSRSLNPTRTKNVLEVGCGMGWKGLCWGDLFDQYVGLELNEESARQANAQFKKYGMRNCWAICGNAETILQQPEKYGLPRVDVLVLYAVLEHLTIPERRAILRLAQDVYQRGGAILIAESPNRLCRFDQHTWQLPFGDLLPNELMEVYATRSGRVDLFEQLETAATDRKQEAMQRLGRGISYHEFECFWDKPLYDRMNILSDGYSPELLNLYPFIHDEQHLQSFFWDNDISVHRLFSRYWIEGLISQQLEGRVPSRAYYLAPQQLGSERIHELRRVFQLDEATLIPGPAERMTIENPTQIGRQTMMLVDMARSKGTVQVDEKRSGASFEIDLGKIEAWRIPLWHTQVALPLGPALDRTYSVQVDGHKGALVCQGVLFV